MYFYWIDNQKNWPMSKVKFKETQQYKNKVVPVILGIVGVILIIRGITFLTVKEPNFGSAIFLFIVAVAIGALVWGLTKLKLKVAITEKNVKFKLSPVHLKKHSIPWGEIDQCEIVKTSEAAQWSGGNIAFNHEKRYSLTGRNGLAIKTKQGERFFIGCSDVSELRRTLDEMKLKIK